MGEVIKLYGHPGEECLETFVQHVRSGEVASFVVCAVMKDGNVGTALCAPSDDLYRLLGLLEATKSELLSYHEV